MREVIRIEEPQEGKKPVESMTEQEKIIMLQISDIIDRCVNGIDYPLITKHKLNDLFKGHLNSGKY